jgi:hypothetical protein
VDTLRLQKPTPKAQQEGKIVTDSSNYDDITQYKIIQLMKPFVDYQSNLPRVHMSAKKASPLQ